MNSEEILDLIENNKDFLDHTEGLNKVLEEFQSAILISDLPVIEIGTNKGGSSKCFLEILHRANKKNYLISLDPYGNILYHNGAFASTDVSVTNYSNALYHKSMKLLHETALNLEMNFTNVKCTSEDFINHFYENFKLHYESNTKNLDKLAFVFLDGSHDPEVVKKEVDFFSKKIVVGGSIVIDDFKGERFGNYWDEFGKNNPHLVLEGIAPDRVVLKYRS